MQMGAFSFFFFLGPAGSWQVLVVHLAGLARTGKNNITDESQQVFFMLTSNSHSLRTS